MDSWIEALHQAAVELEAQKTSSSVNVKPRSQKNQLPNRICMDCGVVFTPGAQAHWRCDSCYKNKGRQRDKETKQGNVYDHRWEKFKRVLVSLGNVVCQRVNNGVRCNRPMAMFHHILEAQQFPQFAYDWRNVVATCKPCHPHPENQDQGIWVPTLWRPPMTFEPLPLPLVEPNKEVPRAVQHLLWTRDNRLIALQIRSVPA